MYDIIFASLLFLGTHFGLSSTPLRAQLVGLFGATGFLGVYTLVAVATLGYLIWLYVELPRFEYFWLPNPSLYWLPKVAMPIAFIFMLGGFLVRNPTQVGQEGGMRDPQSRAGLVRITRHPFMWSVMLWSASHIAANGDKVSVVFFGTFFLLGLIGTLAIDHKKALAHGDDWIEFSAATSNVPFAAILGGRNKLVIAELVLPVVVGVVGYALAYFFHQYLSGVALV